MSSQTTNTFIIFIKKIEVFLLTPFYKQLSKKQFHQSQSKLLLEIFIFVFISFLKEHMIQGKKI